MLLNTWAGELNCVATRENRTVHFTYDWDSNLDQYQLNIEQEIAWEPKAKSFEVI